MADNRNNLNANPTVPNFTGRTNRDLRFAQRPKLTNVKATIKRLLSYLAPHSRKLLLAFLCAALATLITIIGTRLNGYIVDNFIASANISMLALVCIIMIAMYIIGVASGFIQNLLMIRTAQNISAAIRRDLFSNVQRLPLSYFDSHSSGDIMSRLTNDVDNINNSISQTAVQLFSSIVNVSGMLIAMLILSPLLTLVCLLTSPMTFFATRAVAKRAQRFFIGQQKNLGNMNGFIEEMVSGQKVQKLFSREAHVVSEFNAINDAYIKDAFKAQAASGIIGPTNNLINNFAYLLVAVAGGICVISGFNSISVGIVFSFLLYMRNFTNPINNILTLANSLQLALASSERVFETMDVTPEADPPYAADISDIKGDIRLDNVGFSYIPDKPVLTNASIHAAPGQTIGIVGPTGAGKTTIISLLTRFYNIDEGSILIDGQNIANLSLNSLRNSVSLVLQDTFLFSDTIRENIRYGRLDASDEEVYLAAHQAHAHEFIMQLPHGYDTILSDNGQNLSQGQRQLLNIARSIISQASVLILDEATSSVDTRTEQIIQSALLELMRDKTCFVIAHRLSTIRNADNIVVIDHGQVIEQGTHQQLLDNDGLYARLYDSQFRSGTVADSDS